MSDEQRVIQSVRDCYATWSANYYESYCRGSAAYPPVHYDIVRKLLLEAKAQNVLDVGCGPASFLRELGELGADRFGFDLTPEMVTEAKSILGGQGVPAENIWCGDVHSLDSFHPPCSPSIQVYDAVVSIGVLPHVLAEREDDVLRNIAVATKKNGIAVVEARNQFFSLFTLNRYSYNFFAEHLLPLDSLRDVCPAEKLDALENKLQERFLMNEPPVRSGSEKSPGYDEILSRTHNPFLLARSMRQAGFRDVETLFYHFHCLPPFLASDLGKAFREQSIRMEDARDWRGYFMASAFLIVGRKI